MATDLRCQIIRTVRSPAERPILGSSEILLSDRLDTTRSFRNREYIQGGFIGEVYGRGTMSTGRAHRK